MKKLVILAAILMLVPGLALADMGVLNESSLNDVTGQVGITINQTLDASIGSLSWTDSDGDTATGATYTASGTLTLTSIDINNGATGIVLEGLTIDCGANAAGDKSALVIGLPSITGQVTVGSINIGTGNLGAVTISGISTTDSTVTIMAH